MTWLTVILGMICATHAGWLSLRFARVDRIGARAVKWILFGQTVSMAVLTVFAYAEWTGTIREIDPAVASLMRGTAFAATLGSTLHLGFMISTVDRWDS